MVGGTLTTNVLDTARGRPAAGLRIDLAVIGPDGRPRPRLDQAYRAVEVAVLRPLPVKHRRLGGDADVFRERGDDRRIPRALDELAELLPLDGHDAGW